MRADVAFLHEFIHDTRVWGLTRPVLDRIGRSRYSHRGIYPYRRALTGGALPIFVLLRRPFELPGENPPRYISVNLVCTLTTAQGERFPSIRGGLSIHSGGFLSQCLIPAACQFYSIGTLSLGLGDLAVAPDRFSEPCGPAGARTVSPSPSDGTWSPRIASRLPHDDHGGGW